MWPSSGIQEHAGGRAKAAHTCNIAALRCLAILSTLCGAKDVIRYGAEHGESHAGLTVALAAAAVCVE